MPLSYPNETDAYRSARNDLLDAEIALRAQLEAVAAKRRALPPGGELSQDYAFTGQDGETRTLSSLFGDKTTLALYSYMYAPDAARPCRACTSLPGSVSPEASGLPCTVPANRAQAVTDRNGSVPSR